MSCSLHLSSIHLRVANLDRSLDFYTRQVGMVLIRQNGAEAELAPALADKPILTLTRDHSASPQPPDAAGLFHAALLLPSRAALGRWLRFAVGQGVQFAGFSDHGVSEALYLSDPDGNGLEVYADRPRPEWPFRNGKLAMTTEPIDLDSLVAAGGAAPAGDAVTSGAAWGHLHLRVTDLDASEEFYRDALGLSLTQGDFPGARFLAADNYHHHLGLNIWGNPRRAKPRNTLGLSCAIFARMDAHETRSVGDPNGIEITIIPFEPAGKRAGSTATR
ncbi:MAG: hypothetical protein RIQ93_2977 [Verrucomicrobiota bacterium]|jgi:catechol 2,3-dioxygenase